MKLTKFLVSVLLVATLIFGCVFSLPMYVGAADVDTAETSAWSQNYNLTGKGADDIVSVAYAQMGKTKAELGYNIQWCAAFVSDCARLAGQSSAVPYNAGVAYLYDAVINAGGYKVSTPQAGDLVFYFCTTDNWWCHVAIMTDSVNSIHGNVGTSVTYVNCRGYRDQYYNYETKTGGDCCTAPICTDSTKTDPMVENIKF